MHEAGDHHQQQLSVETDCAFVNVLTPGDLCSLRWIESPLKHFTSTDRHQLCRVHYAAINFRDVMLATGKLPPDAIPGTCSLQTFGYTREISRLQFEHLRKSFATFSTS